MCANDLLREKPSLFMLLGWSLITINSLIMHSMRPDFIARIPLSWNWIQ